MSAALGRASISASSNGRIGFVRLDGTRVLTHGSCGVEVAEAHLANFPDLVPIPPSEFVKLCDGFVWDWDGQAMVSSPEPSHSLDALKASALLQIDAQAEETHLARRTPGVGQAQEYAMTLADARRASLAADPLEPSDYPWLKAEQRALGSVGRHEELRVLAEAVLAANVASMDLGLEVKELRRYGKLSVAAALNADEVADVLKGTLGLLRRLARGGSWLDD